MYPSFREHVAPLFLIIASIIAAIVFQLQYIRTLYNALQPGFPTVVMVISVETSDFHPYVDAPYTRYVQYQYSDGHTIRTVTLEEKSRNPRESVGQQVPVHVVRRDPAIITVTSQVQAGLWPHALLTLLFMSAAGFISSSHHRQPLGQASPPLMLSMFMVYLLLIIALSIVRTTLSTSLFGVSLMLTVLVYVKHTVNSAGSKQWFPLLLAITLAAFFLWCFPGSSANTFPHCRKPSSCERSDTGRNKHQVVRA